MNHSHDKNLKVLPATGHLNLPGLPRRAATTAIGVDFSKSHTLGRFLALARKGRINICYSSEVK